MIVLEKYIQMVLPKKLMKKIMTFENIFQKEKTLKLRREEAHRKLRSTARKTKPYYVSEA